MKKLPGIAVFISVVTFVGASSVYAATLELGLAEKAANLYQTALGIGVVLALGVLVYGGVRYTVSAGNPSGIKDAKDWIAAAFLGLFILFGAFLVLNTINPNLTNLESILVAANLLQKPSEPILTLPDPDPPVRDFLGLIGTKCFANSECRTDLGLTCQAGFCQPSVPPVPTCAGECIIDRDCEARANPELCENLCIANYPPCPTSVCPLAKANVTRLASGWFRRSDTDIGFRSGNWSRKVSCAGIGGGENGIALEYARDGRCKHSGYDINALEDKPVYAVEDGVIAAIDTSWKTIDPSGCGHSINLSVPSKGPDGTTFRYCHLNDVYVRKGQTVSAGQIIGTNGRTGARTFHVHLSYLTRAGIETNISRLNSEKVNAYVDRICK